MFHNLKDFFILLIFNIDENYKAVLIEGNGDSNENSNWFSYIPAFTLWIFLISHITAIFNA